jgi:hypothetical protein
MAAAIDTTRRWIARTTGAVGLALVGAGPFVVTVLAT